MLGLLIILRTKRVCPGAATGNRRFMAGVKYLLYVGSVAVFMGVYAIDNVSILVRWEIYDHSNCMPQGADLI